jgi:hypothetical protein
MEVGVEAKPGPDPDDIRQLSILPKNNLKQIHICQFNTLFVKVPQASC